MSAAAIGGLTGFWRVIWSPQALEQVAGIVAYLTEINPQAATDLARSLFDAAESLQQHPLRGRATFGGLRELLAVAPYIIRYRVTAERVLIIRVRHAMRLQ